MVAKSLVKSFSKASSSVGARMLAALIASASTLSDKYVFAATLYSLFAASMAGNHRVIPVVANGVTSICLMSASKLSMAVVSSSRDNQLEKRNSWLH